MYIYETHMHTSPVSACARATPAEQVRAYRDKGYAGIIVTDHFLNGNTTCPRDLPWEQRVNYYVSGYEDAKKEGDAIGIDVFFGWEYRCSDGTEFLTYGLGIDFLLDNPDMDKLAIERYSALIRKHGGYLAQAHPYRTDPWVTKQSAVHPNLVDGIEIYNASMPDETNRKACDFTRKNKLPVQSGSDSHSVSLPFTSGVGLKHRARGIQDIVAAIRSGSAQLIVPREFA